MPVKPSKPRRYSGTPEFYRKKLDKVMEGLGMKREHYDLKYDPWEGARLDFTYKGVTRRLERLLDKDLQFGSDALAQITLTMEKFLWMKRENIFDLEVAAAGLPQLMPAVPDFFREMDFQEIPANVGEVVQRYRLLANERHPDKGGSNEAMVRLNRARDQALAYFDGMH